MHGQGASVSARCGVGAGEAGDRSAGDAPLPGDVQVDNVALVVDHVGEPCAVVGNGGRDEKEGGGRRGAGAEESCGGGPKLAAGPPRPRPLPAPCRCGA